MFIVLVTGSRTWDDWFWIYDDLNVVASRTGDDIILRHGDCPEGADYIAKMWAELNGIQQDKMHADWNQYGKRAGFVRNSAMVEKDPRPNLCLAYVDPCNKPNCKTSGLHGSHGGTMCGELAEKAGIQVDWRRPW